MLPRFAPLLLRSIRLDSPHSADEDAVPLATRQLATLPLEDWDALTTDAIRYRLAHQFTAWLKADPERLNRVPESCRARLQAAVRRTLMYNLAQQASLRRMLTACAAAGVPVLLLKGLWVGEIVYRDLAARLTGDIDLLLRPEDMPRFTALARELGFDVPHGVTSLSELAPTSNEFPLFHPVHKGKVDVHWALTHPTEEKSIDEAKLWERAETFTIAGAPCRSLRVEDHLLLLCFHAAHHHRFLYVGPRALLDVATTIARPPRPLDWDDLVARAREMGWERGTWLVFDLVREHLGVQPPQRVLDALRPGITSGAIKLDSLRKAALEAMFLGQQHQESLGINVVRVWDEQSWPKRVRMLLRLFFPPRESVAAQFQTPVDTPGLRLLYAKRWYLLFKNHFGKFVDLAKGGNARSAEFERARQINGWIDG